MPADPAAAGGAADESTDTRIPLTIITGFLGAGKTTLLNGLINGRHGLRVAVLVNDFGSVNIDAELVVGVEEDMISLANGCVCCEIRDDLIGAVQRLVESADPPEHIVLEASGVADPAGIWATFAESGHPEWVRLDGVVCVVDTDQIFANLDEAPDLLMLKARQIGFADLVVLNKVDLAGPRTVAWVRDWIDKMMDRVRLVEAVQAEVPLDILLGAGSGEPAQATPAVLHPQGHALEADVEGHDHDHNHEAHGDSGDGTHRRMFRTWTYETDAGFDREALQEMIRRELPGTVYRCKGFVNVAGQDGGRMLLQSVGRRSELTAAPPGDGRSGSSRIVAIATDDLDEVALREAFDSCLAVTG